MRTRLRIGASQHTAMSGKRGDMESGQLRRQNLLSQGRWRLSGPLLLPWFLANPKLVIASQANLGITLMFHTSDYLLWSIKGSKEEPEPKPLLMQLIKLW